MRHLLLSLGLAVTPAVAAQNAAPPPPPVPQAVRALEYLRTQPNAGPTSWTNGPYDYDGAGNIRTIGPETYVYDKIGRLKSSTLRGPDLSSTQTQSFDYDAYGNLIGTSKLGQTVLLPITGTTNRLSAFAYDAAGNVTAAGAQHYDYDAVGMPNVIRIGTNARPRIIYAYTADDERLFAFDVSTGTTHWTLRGFDNKVLRDFRQNGSAWTVERDYVYRDGLLLAALKSGGAVEHYSLDHLGTPRLVTDAAGHKIGYHVYWPFGEEWSPGTAQDGTPLQFTGHERDADAAGATAPLDYMHARYYGAGWGRFLAVDPSMDLKTTIRNPQMWNRYSYVVNDPIRYADPNGREHVQEPGFTKPYPEWSETLKFDENTPTVIKGSFYAEGALLAAGALSESGLFSMARAGLSAIGDAAAWAGNRIAAMRTFAAAAEATRRVAGDPNRMSHIFDNAAHDLDGLVRSAGSQERVVNAVARGVLAMSKIPTNAHGVFSVTVRLNGQNVQVTGRIINDAVHISNFWVR